MGGGVADRTSKAPLRQERVVIHGVAEARWLEPRRQTRSRRGSGKLRSDSICHHACLRLQCRGWCSTVLWLPLHILHRARVTLALTGLRARRVFAIPAEIGARASVALPFRCERAGSGATSEGGHHMRGNLAEDVPLAHRVRAEARDSGGLARVPPARRTLQADLETTDDAGSVASKHRG